GSMGGFVGTAISSLLAEEGPSFLTPGLGQVEPKVRSVIYLFMCGGVSHIDTFDPKDKRWEGTFIDAIGFGDNLAAMKRPVIPCHREFTRYGQSGIPVSDWFPHVGEMVDDIAVVRSMFCRESNHFPAVIETATGHRGRQLENPTLGSWVNYALGTANRNLPTFVNIGRPTSPVQLTGGYLGAEHSATPFQSNETPIPNLKSPETLSSKEQRHRLGVLATLNSGFREEYEFESAIAARRHAYELAARMQLSAPETVDFDSEPGHVKELYGIGEKETDSFGRQLLLARRLAERNVRFIQVCHGGGGNGRWDSHSDMKSHAPLCRETDRPIAGLLRDLKNRGMLDSTLVVWTSEFGRTPWSENTTGRDHNPKGFTSWLAGGGVKGGTVYGATDDVGYRAVSQRTYIADLQATILHQLGLDAEKMEVEVDGRPVRLIDRFADPIFGVLS
ncbi:MAG: DUF1501 domain-containing protein, partial [Verrucomicrobia bacterium]|nr:DUF1501 domain-containing protein [Verrucomicrobiota bacterium]